MFLLILAAIVLIGGLIAAKATKKGFIGAVAVVLCIVYELRQGRKLHPRFRCSFS